MADINGVELSYATKDEYDFEGGEYDDGEVQTAMEEDYNGNVKVTAKQRLATIQQILDDMQNLNGRKGKSKYGFINTNGRRQLKRIGQFLNEIGEEL
tara:strand:+ start:193 stop:483 length:291 start_codon:yes stop_codon:yes gene_type:complete